MEDPGISNERTALAWQRNALALVAGSGDHQALEFDQPVRGRDVSPAHAGARRPELVESQAHTPTAPAIRASALRCQANAVRSSEPTAALALATIVLAAVELVALIAEHRSK